MRPLPRQHLLSAALVAAFGISTAALTPSAIAQTSSRVAGQLFDISLPAQPLHSALNELSRQTGVQIFVDGEIVADIRSRTVSGRLSAEQALQQLLAGTSLEALRNAGGDFAIRRTSGERASSLPPVTVTSERELATGHVAGYIAKSTVTASKTDTPLIEMPQSISVVTADQVEAQKAQSVIDALAYSAGVTVRESSRATESLVLRGFQADGQSGSLYRDGTKSTSNLYRGQQEPYGLERIELLRGAASVLYGSAAPGGIINSVSKRPTLDTLREVNVEYGSFNRKQTSADFSGKLTEDGEWSYRLTGLLRDSDTFIDRVPDNRVFIAPALTWRPSAATSLTVLGQYKKTESKYIYGLSPYGTTKYSANGTVPRSRFYGEPADRYEDRNTSLGYILEHSFNDRLKLRQNVRAEHMDTIYDYTYDYGLTDSTQRISQRGFDQSASQDRSLTADTSLEYKWGSDNVLHTTLLGYDFSRQNETVQRYALTLSPTDIFNPSFGETPANPTPNIYATNRKLSRSGVYVQDQMKIANKWVVLLGGRYDWTKNGISAFAGPSTWGWERNDAFTGRAGLVYLAENGLAPFVSFSQSFEPAAGLGRSGERFKPTEGQQYEAGIRYQPAGSDTLLTATVFQLTQQNVLTLDPVNIAFQVQTGEKRSQGLELEAKTVVARNLSLLASYAYTDAKTTKSNTASEVGTRSPFTPRNQASVWTDYRFGDLGLPGLKIGGGLRYVGSTTGFAYINNVVPSYTVFDAMLSYSTGPWKLSLNVTNLANKSYISNCTYGCFYGEARRAVATATYRW